MGVREKGIPYTSSCTLKGFHEDGGPYFASFGFANRGTNSHALYQAENGRQESHRYLAQYLLPACGRRRYRVGDTITVRAAEIYKAENDEALRKAVLEEYYSNGFQEAARGAAQFATVLAQGSLHEEARDYLERALAIREHLLPRNSADIDLYITREMLAKACLELGDHDRTWPL